MSQTPKVRSIQRKLAEKDALLAALRPEHSRLLARIDVLEKGEGIADAEARVRNAETALADAEARLEEAEAGRRNAERSTVAYLALLLERETIDRALDLGENGASFRFTREDLFRALPLGARVRFEEDGDAIVVRLAGEDEVPAADPLAAQAVLAPAPVQTVGLSTFDPEAPVAFAEEAPAGQRFGAGRIELGDFVEGLEDGDVPKAISGFDVEKNEDGGEPPVAPV